MNKNQNIILLKKGKSFLPIAYQMAFTCLQDQSGTLKQTKECLSSLKGVYAFLHNDTQKAYIGSSSNLAKRISEHLKGNYSNIHLQRAFGKYGFEQFSLFILEFLLEDPNISVVDSLTALIQLEQKYIDIFDDKYNINPVAGKSRLGAKHSEEAKELMSR